MTNRLLLLALLSFPAVAQSPGVPLIVMESIERQWPTSLPGDDTDLACGQFVANHPGRGVVVVRSGALHLLFQPAHFEHFEPADVTGVGPIAAIPTTTDAPDLLGAASTAGLRVLRYTSEGFVDAVVGQGLLTAWAGARDLECGQFEEPGLPSRYLLAHAPTWVRVAAVDTDGTVLPPVAFTAPPGTTVLDANLIDWVPGGVPEVVVMLETGTCVFDAAGTVLYWHSHTAIGGRLQPLLRGTVPSFVQVRNTGTSYRLETFLHDPAGVVYTDGGNLPLSSAPLGIAEFDVDGNEYPDAVVSSGESLRRILIGTATGFSSVSALRVNFLDVDAGDLPTPCPVNMASLAVDDIDRDGNDDFVIAQRPTDRLVVMRQVRTQVQLLVNLEDDPGVTVPALAFEAGLGFGEQQWGCEDPEDHGFFALRLRLPTNLSANMNVDAIVYPIRAEGSAPAGTDPADLGAIAHYRYPVPNGSDGMLFDLLVPILHTDMVGEGSPLVSRFLFEFSLVEGVSGTPLKGTTPMFIECARAIEPQDWYLQFIATLNPYPLLYWWFEGYQFTEVEWDAGGVPTSGSVPDDPLPIDSRFVGGLLPLDEQRTDDAPEIPAVKLLNGVAH